MVASRVVAKTELVVVQGMSVVLAVWLARVTTLVMLLLQMLELMLLLMLMLVVMLILLLLTFSAVVLQVVWCTLQQVLVYTVQHVCAFAWCLSGRYPRECSLLHG